MERSSNSSREWVKMKIAFFLWKRVWTHERIFLHTCKIKDDSNDDADDSVWILELQRRQENMLQVDDEKKFKWSEEE